MTARDRRRRPAGGRAAVLAVEAVLPKGPEPHRAKTLDVLMLAVTGGREQTLAQYHTFVAAPGSIPWP